jgi:hypothetical protein
MNNSFENIDRYPTKLLNRFYVELFSTDFRDYDSPTQNAKTDYLFDVDTFEEWFEKLIKVFVSNTEVDENQLRQDISNCPEFVNDMRFEYDELLEILS